MTLTDQVAIVTGASRGLGRAIALALARGGAHVVVAARTEPMPGTIEETAAMVEELGRRALPIEMNVTDEAQVQGMVARTLETFGRIDILVNNAGVMQTKPLLDLTEEDWDRIVDVNQRGLFLCLQAVAAQMVAQVPDDREVSGATPTHEKIEAEDVRFSYVDGRDVLHGVSLDVGVGERIAMVGPSGAGKSTLGRLLAGIHPPRTGSVTVGGVGLVELPLSDLRGHVALVTQEHHVFVGTLRENLALAAPPGAGDAEIRGALDAVDALDWVDALPEGLDTVVGSGGRALTDAQAQQVALARLVLADPHTLVLDEATSLIDPRAARHLERSLAAVLHGRTVIAIAHRLFSAHDADRVAVVEDGVISEFGSHDELVEAGGSYAALWDSWNGRH